MSEVFQKISEWLVSSAKEKDIMEIRAYDADSWMIAFDESTFIQVELDEERGVLVFSCNLGMPHPGEELGVYQILLEASSLWDTTGGVYFALDGSDDAERGSVVQVYSFPFKDIEADSLWTRLENFSGASREWKDIVLNYRTDDKPADSSITHDEGIKV